MLSCGQQPLITWPPCPPSTPITSLSPDTNPTVGLIRPCSRHTDLGLSLFGTVAASLKLSPIQAHPQQASKVACA